MLMHPEKGGNSPNVQSHRMNDPQGFKSSLNGALNQGGGIVLAMNTHGHPGGWQGGLGSGDLNQQMINWAKQNGGSLAHVTMVDGSCQASKLDDMVRAQRAAGIEPMKYLKGISGGGNQLMTRGVSMIHGRLAKLTGFSGSLPGNFGTGDYNGGGGGGLFGGGGGFGGGLMPLILASALSSGLAGGGGGRGSGSSSSSSFAPQQPRPSANLNQQTPSGSSSSSSSSTSSSAEEDVVVQIETPTESEIRNPAPGSLEGDLVAELQSIDQEYQEALDGEQFDTDAAFDRVAREANALRMYQIRRDEQAAAQRLAIIRGS